MDLGSDRCLNDLLVRGVGPAVADILSYGSGKHEHILLDDADIPAQAALGHVPHIHAVHGDAAAADIVKTGQKLAEGGLSSAGGSYNSETLSRLHTQIDMAENGYAVAIVKGDVLILDLTTDRSHFFCIRPILYARLGTHDLKKTADARGALHVHLGKLSQPLYRRDESGHIKGKGDQVHIVHLSAHDQYAAHGNNDHLNDAGGKLHSAHIQAHGLVILHLGAAKQLVCLVELIALLLLVGKGLGGADTGDAALYGGRYLSGLFLYLHIGVLHSLSLGQSEPEAKGERHRDHQGKPPLNGEHYSDGTDNGQRADHHILRPVVGKLGDFKKVAGDSAHQHAGAVLIVKAAGQVLHMGEDIPPHIGFHQNAHPVSHNGDHVIEKRPENKGQDHDAHHRKEGSEQTFRQKPVHGYSGYIGKDHIDNRHDNRADHVDGKQVFMPHDIGDKNFKRLVVIVFIHFLPLRLRICPAGLQQARRSGYYIHCRRVP